MSITDRKDIMSVTDRKDSKSSKYSQRYRSVWESDDRFKTWLQPVPGDVAKARCKVCNVTIRAHIKSLVGHRDSKKHSRFSSIVQELDISAGLKAELSTNTHEMVLVMEAAEAITSSQKIAVVTGGNKGIGFAIVRNLCKTFEFEGVVYLTARNASLGKSAVKELQKENLFPIFHQLDIDCPRSIRAFRNHLEKQHGGLDILINNAAIAYKKAATEPIGEQATNTVRVNFFGTRNVCQELFPLLRPHARVVNVSSAAGFLGNLKGSDAATQLKMKLGSLDLTDECLCELMRDFIRSAVKGCYRERGWPDRTYTVSKIGVSALSRIQQREFDKKPELDIIVNHVHPGLVITDMSSGKGNLTIDEASETPVWLATLPQAIESPRGEFIWHDAQIVDWVNGPLPISS